MTEEPQKNYAELRRSRRAKVAKAVRVRPSDGRDEHFDPDIVDAMLVIEEQFRAIGAEFPDAE